MALNVIQPFGISFDKYPFILLNLALSTLAAVQAPLIMMSQNRASDYDRLQARNDYHVNKQSKEEIRFCMKRLITWCNKTSLICLPFKNCRQK